jgi:hypothetical protein
MESISEVWKGKDVPALKRGKEEIAYEISGFSERLNVTNLEFFSASFFPLLRNLNSFESIARTTTSMIYSATGDADHIPSRPKKTGRMKSKGKSKTKILPRLMKSASLTLFID